MITKEMVLVAIIVIAMIFGARGMIKVIIKDRDRHSGCRTACLEFGAANYHTLKESCYCSTKGKATKVYGP